jgi:hypothetical protein
VKVKLTIDMFRVLNVLNSSLESASLNDTSIENTNLDRNSVFFKKIVMSLKWQSFISVFSQIWHNLFRV